MASANYVASFGAGFSGTTHGIRPGWRYDALPSARTWCGIPGSFGIQHMNSGEHIAISCGNCKRSGNRFRALSITVTLSDYYVESNESDTWETDPHNFHSEELEWDDDMREEYPDPIEWAVSILTNWNVVRTPRMAGFPELSPSCYPIGSDLPPHAWMSGTRADNYTTEETEWTVRLPSAWSTSERATVFQRVTNPRNR